MPVKPLKLARLERTYRGQKFVFEEADTDTYDECVRKGTESYTDSMGEEQERINDDIVLRALLRQCLIEPKMASFSGLGARLTRQLLRDVRLLNLGDEPDQTPKSKKVDDEDDEAPNVADG